MKGLPREYKTSKIAFMSGEGSHQQVNQISPKGIGCKHSLALSRYLNFNHADKEDSNQTEIKFCYVCHETVHK